MTYTGVFNTQFQFSGELLEKLDALVARKASERISRKMSPLPPEILKHAMKLGETKGLAEANYYLSEKQREFVQGDFKSSTISRRSVLMALCIESIEAEYAATKDKPMPSQTIKGKLYGAAAGAPRSGSRGRNLQAKAEAGKPVRNKRKSAVGKPKPKPLAIKSAE